MCSTRYTSLLARFSLPCCYKTKAMGPFRIFFMLLPLIFFYSGFSQEVISKSPFVIGESVTLHSKVLGENRVLNIYLPHGYSPDSSKTYPVIYLLDGSIDEDIIHVAGLVQFCSFPWIRTLPETIVVGIGNTDRQRDFTFPTENEEEKEQYPTTGGSEKFMRFLHEELLPFIGKNYQVDSVETLIGQSLGGLLATQVLFKKPRMFDHYIIVSQSLWWSNASLLKLQTGPAVTVPAVYIGVGKEGEMMENAARELYEKLKRIAPAGEQLYFRTFEERDHGDVLHEALYDAFGKLFSQENRGE